MSRIVGPEPAAITVNGYASTADPFLARGLA
jgi:hypothetical protein